MSQITVIGGTGYVGSAVVAEAASRGHHVTALSRSVPAQPVAGVRYVQGSADDSEVLGSVIDGADAVVAALSPRGALAGRLRPVYRSVARVAADAGAELLVVGGFNALRPAPGAPRFLEGEIPAPYEAEAREVAAVLTDDLPQAPASLRWTFVSPPATFGAYVPGERLGHYRLGDDVALVDGHGVGAVSGADFALAVVDLIESTQPHPAHVGVAY